ncbi:MAG: NrtA/SsuA/CpmA family ABC transporter substrate-binding protein [Thermodesulfobacteriota bacterium]
MALAISPTANASLVAIAHEKGFFKDEGIEISLATKDSGRDSLEAVSRGKVQAATASCFAFSTRALNDPSLRVLASIGATTGSRIVARKDRNIRKPSDLKGKRIGYVSDTISEYYLHSFLVTENLRIGDVKAVDLPAGRHAEALARGEVDAISASEFYAYRAERLLGENVVAWDCQNNIAYQWLLVVREDSLQSPEPLKRLLKALIRAENFTRANEEEARGIVVRRLGVDPDYAQEAWNRTHLDVSLSQSVVTNLRVFTRWRMRRSGQDGKPPDVLEYLSPGILDEVAPESVTVYR